MSVIVENVFVKFRKLMSVLKLAYDFLQLFGCYIAFQTY